MQNKRQTIRKIVGFLNNAEEDGGFWLPNIQRPFIWSEEQICRLFDSILRQYPISTLLIWKTKEPIIHRSFIANWKNPLSLSVFNVLTNNKKKCLVLDGQQRLQSLFIGLYGSYEGKELYFDILSGDVAAPDDMKFKFKFLDPQKALFPSVNFKELVCTNKKRREMIDSLKVKAGRDLTERELNKLDDHLEAIDNTFKIYEAVTYQELDGIDNQDLYNEDDVVEIFIRANSGGTILGKSDLLFSLLIANWGEAQKKMEDLLASLNRYGFAFDRDFVLKTCLVLLKKNARYEVKKFRTEGVRENIVTKWSDIAKAIQDVLDFVRSKTYIQCDKALPSYLVLIPIIYARYHFYDAWKNAKDVDRYLLRSLLSGAFSGQSDNLIDVLIKRIEDIKSFNLEEAFAVIRSQGRSLELTEDRFWLMGYGSKTIHLLFNLWYPTFTHVPAYENNLPQIDHIFPRSRLAKVKIINPETGRQVMKYQEDALNQLANCMLLTKAENGSGGKRDALPSEWFADKPSEYLDLHLIPNDPSLWEMDRYEDFIEARKTLIRDRFKWLLTKTINESTV